MALSKQTLINNLKAALKECAAKNEKLDPRDVDVMDKSFENLANAFAGAIDSFVRSAEVSTSVKVDVSTRVEKNGVYVGDGSGTGTGTGSGSLK